jgi:hypothetical protein
LLVKSLGPEDRVQAGIVWNTFSAQLQTIINSAIETEEETEPNGEDGNDKSCLGESYYENSSICDGSELSSVAEIVGEESVSMISEADQTNENDPIDDTYSITDLDETNNSKRVISRFHEIVWLN